MDKVATSLVVALHLVVHVSCQKNPKGSRPPPNNGALIGGLIGGILGVTIILILIGIANCYFCNKKKTRAVGPHESAFSGPPPYTEVHLSPLRDKQNPRTAFGPEFTGQSSSDPDVTGPSQPFHPTPQPREPIVQPECVSTGSPNTEGAPLSYTSSTTGIHSGPSVDRPVQMNITETPPQ